MLADLTAQVMIDAITASTARDRQHGFFRTGPSDKPFIIGLLGRIGRIYRMQLLLAQLGGVGELQKPLFGSDVAQAASL